MKIKEIDDIEFRKAVFKAISAKDRRRRFEVHFTDLPYSLILAFYNKLFPQEYSEEEYRAIARWMRGIGHEIGFVNLLRSFFSPTHQKLTVLGKAQGSIDLVFQDIIYEVTTTVSFPEWRKLPYIGKALQLIYYMASERANKGRLKIFLILGQKRNLTKVKPEDRKYVVERTWEITLTDEEIEHYRKIIRKKSRLLHKALLSGDWTKLPRTNHLWLRDIENEKIRWMRENPEEVRKAHKEWLKAREKFIKTQKKYS